MIMNKGKKASLIALLQRERGVICHVCARLNTQVIFALNTVEVATKCLYGHYKALVTTLQSTCSGTTKCLYGHYKVLVGRVQQCL